MAQLAIESAVLYFPAEFQEKTTSVKQAQSDSSTTAASASSFPSDPPTVIYNDGTAAGILDALKGCTRTLCFHEADVSMKSLNILMPSPLDRGCNNKVDNFRSTLMTVFDKPANFNRCLKKERIRSVGSKLNIMGAGTGDLFVSQLARQATSSTCDALFERILIWPLDGKPIPNEACLKQIDFMQYPSLEQFGIISAFFGDLELKPDDETDKRLADWSFNMRLAANEERSNDHLAARLSKLSLAMYRITGFITLCESTFQISQQYVQNGQSFGDGEMTKPMFSDLRSLVNDLHGYPPCTLCVDAVTASRGHKVTLANLQQYKVLMNLGKDDAYNWNSYVPFGATTSSASSSTVCATRSLSTTTSKKAANLLSKSNLLKVNILLHDSLLFIKSGLYVDRQLKMLPRFSRRTFSSNLRKTASFTRSNMVLLVRTTNQRSMSKLSRHEELDANLKRELTTPSPSTDFKRFRLDDTPSLDLAVPTSPVVSALNTLTLEDPSVVEFVFKHFGDFSGSEVSDAEMKVFWDTLTDF
ncbi:unnamed protein product [Sphagnum troendelagicum]